MTVITVIANLCAKTQSEIALSRTAPAGRGVPTMWKVNTISHLNRLFQTGLISSSFKCPRYTFEYNFFFGFFFTNFWRKVVSPLNWDDRLWAAVKSFTVPDQLWFQVGSNGESHVKSRKGDLTMRTAPAGAVLDAHVPMGTIALGSPWPIQIPDKDFTSVSPPSDISGWYR